MSRRKIAGDSLQLDFMAALDGSLASVDGLSPTQPDENRRSGSAAQGGHGLLGDVSGHAEPCSDAPGGERPSAPAKVRPAPRRYGRQDQDQLYESAANAEPMATVFDIDPPKRRNAGFRVRRDLRQELLIDMPLMITGVELRAGVAQDDRAWNRRFEALRDDFVKEVGYLRLVVGERVRVELAWQQPIHWPICALRAPDGRRLVQTDSEELARYGVRGATMLWKSILDKQQALQRMARDYEALLRWMAKLPDKVGEAMDGAKSCRLLLEPEINRQINQLQWPRYHRDTAGGAFCPLPFTVAEAMRVRLWAHAKAVKQHVHAMNLNYNRVTNDKRASLGKTRPAALAVGLVDGPCRTPKPYWALWVRKGPQNLFYRTVTPRVVSRSQGKYTTPETFPVCDREGRLRTEAIDRCHLTHMKEVYRASDHALAALQSLSLKTAQLIAQTMGQRHGSDSPAAAGRGQWRGSGEIFRWFPGQ